MSAILDEVVKLANRADQLANARFTALKVDIAQIDERLRALETAANIEPECIYAGMLTDTHLQVMRTMASEIRSAFPYSGSTFVKLPGKPTSRGEAFLALWAAYERLRALETASTVEPEGVRADALRRTHLQIIRCMVSKLRAYSVEEVYLKLAGKPTFRGKAFLALLAAYERLAAIPRRAEE